MDKVFEKTRELGEALLESEAYTRMKAAEEKAMHNAQAAEMMSAYLEKRGAIQELMEVENPDPAAMKRLSDEMIDDIAELTQARSEFNGLIGQINQVLQFIVTGRMDDGSECSGSCESCKGCH